MLLLPYNVRDLYGIECVHLTPRTPTENAPIKPFQRLFYELR